MDAPYEGFDEVERGKATFAIERNEPVTSSLRTEMPSASSSLSTTVQSSPESDSEPVSPISKNDDFVSFDVSITPPPNHPELSRHSSGLPPTPPTLTNSDVAESKLNRSFSPPPLFADRVRNALEAQKSGISTPVVESHSPPTPESSPPGLLPALDIPRPLLSHQMSAAESFQTAAEGRSMDDSTSQVDLQTFPAERVGQDHKYLSASTPAQSTKTEPTHELDALGWSDRSDREEARVKTYQLESDTDGEKARVKNYQAESDSDMDQNPSYSVNSKGRNTAEDSPTSPTLRKELDQRAAYQRLRKPIQPGDAIARPDAALLYGSVGRKKQPNGSDEVNVQPRREMDTEFLRNAKLVQSKTPELLRTTSPKPSPDSGREMETPQTSQIPAEKPVALREFAPSKAPPEPTPPSTAQKESLDENNIVYRMIQEENAKRHSGISDGSVQAVVVPVAHHKRKLRHSPKRESLRGDISMASNSKRSSSESGHKLKHKKATIGGIETSPDASPDQDAVKLLARISRFDQGESGFELWSSMPDPDHLAKEKAEAKTSTPSKDVAEPSFKPRRLRRSLRERGLDKQSSVTDATEERPGSMGSSAAQQSASSPKLRRSSQEQRLEKNNEVRRTSLGREFQTVSQSIDTKLDLVAEDLTREGREMRDRTSVKERRASSDQSFQTTTSPRRKSFDPRHIQPMGTPYSASAFSDRTEAEVLEARGVEFFPHNNDSLLVIQHASQTISKPIKIDTALAPALKSLALPAQSQPAVFEAYVEAPPESRDGIGKPKYAVESPLTNPRTAPEPPVIKFIPPTPNQELEQRLEEGNGTESDPSKGVQRRLSLSQRVRRYSESLIQPLPFGRGGSVRKHESKRVTTMPEARPTYLSSFWQPRDFWEEYDSDEESDDYEPLPRGGDTSNVVEKRRNFLPRNMSVRMPGFRGTGGFLVGNSLGLDRHGTNNRRHYINKRTSEEMMRRLAERRRKRTFTLPFSRGTKVEYIGLAGIGVRMQEAKKRRQEKALEMRREQLRRQIGTRLYHDGRCGVS